MSSAEQRQFWLIQFEPLQKAMMVANRRVLIRDPPLHTFTDHGADEWKELELCIRQITHPDTTLTTLCKDFMRACSQADLDWCNALHSVREGGNEHPGHDEIVQDYDRHHDGRKHLQAVPALYEKLSQHLAILLA
jgi:hypothetical protein